MAEENQTFTVDTQPETEVLTEEEQDSLAVGEKLVAEQEGLLAGKYKSAEDLEAAYLSLQQKLGEGNNDGVQEGQEAEEVKAEETKEEVEEPVEATPAMALITEASDEYYKNDGVLSEKTIEKFSGMSSQDLVNAYIEAQKQNPNLNATEPTRLSDADVNTVQNAAGGIAEYNKVVDWAGQNLDNKSIKAFDSVVDSGNIAAINIAFQGLKSKYTEANGYEGRMLTGKAPKKQGDVYRSQAELVRAMNDPRYDEDPAYRADVVAKLQQSDLNF